MMIEKQSLIKVVNEHIAGKGMFLVDVQVGNSNEIRVLVDSMEGVTIEECVLITKWLTPILEEMVENFSLEVSSPGLDMPLAIPQQYQKNIGREVEVLFNDGRKKKGTLLEADNDGVTIETTEKMLAGGSQKKKKHVKVNKSYPFDEIKSTKIIISF